MTGVSRATTTPENRNWGKIIIGTTFDNVTIDTTGTYGIVIDNISGSATFSNTKVSGTPSGGLSNPTTTFHHRPRPRQLRLLAAGSPPAASRLLFILGDMTIQRMDNVAIVVDDLDAAVAFFTELGMELEGKGQVEGLWADRTVGLDGVRSDIAMMRTPDGHSKLELTKYHTPAASGAEPENPPPNTLGLHRVMFAVDDIDDTVARLRAHGAELLGEVAQYESTFRLCYLRGPAGIIVALAEQIG
jgi:catechol 2,3-dioxygenase-like lactoylglutathione lyase family enzyme